MNFIFFKDFAVLGFLFFLENFAILGILITISFSLSHNFFKISILFFLDQKNIFTNNQIILIVIFWRIS